MRLATGFIASLFGCSLVLAGCSDDPDAESEPFDTLQACFDDHHSGAESLPVAQAITVCCLDHPIAGVAPSCQDTAADCVTHVGAQLDDAVAASDFQAACTDYINQQ